MFPGRTTSDLVKGILDTTTSDLSPFIDTANEIVTAQCVPPAVPLAYSDHNLELIERWLSAHFAAIFDPRTSLEQVDVIRQAFQFKLGLHLDSTMWGQQAMLADWQLGLARLNNMIPYVKRLGQNISITWLGSNRRGCGSFGIGYPIVF